MIKSGCYQQKRRIKKKTAFLSNLDMSETDIIYNLMIKTVNWMTPGAVHTVNQH